MRKNSVFIETYGCQMNIADTEVVQSILTRSGYSLSKEIEDADIILLNTCSVRENAEQRIYGRLGNLKTMRKDNPGLIIGILGCMSERLRSALIDKKKLADVVVGPDEYRKLPEYIEEAIHGGAGIGVRLSRTETYDDIVPYREDGLQAWISVMRGCDKFCTFCVVPFTRGRERSRSHTSILKEVEDLSARGFREVTLLGQNVNSYQESGMNFAALLRSAASIDPYMRVRFMTSHPQDLSDELLETIAAHENICKYIHLPIQSGSDRVLSLMNRTYTVEQYLGIIERARALMPSVSFSTDIISGFPTETLEDHLMTLEVMQTVGYDGAYMFKYSPREGTKAAKMPDDVPEETKGKRLQQIIDLQHKISFDRNQAMIGQEQIMLIEGTSKKSKFQLSGRTDGNKVVVIPAVDGITDGDTVSVIIRKTTSATLLGEYIQTIHKRSDTGTAGAKAS